jgi:glycine cleavage system H lipoate-binding protein
MIWVSLVILTFFSGVLADYIVQRVRGKVEVPETAAVPAMSIAIVELPARYIEGFQVPEGIHYHPGHMWLRRDWKNTVRIGADEFAAKLSGAIGNIELPARGEWFRQGQAIVKLHRNGETTAMVAPIEGEVVDVNTEALRDPSLLRNDSYGKGWLLRLRVYDDVTPLRNLLPASLVPGWMKDAVSRLYAKQPSLVAVAADGGRPVDDLLSGVPNAEWEKITAEFFLV